METNVGQAVVPSGSRDSAEFLSFLWVDRCMVHLRGFQCGGCKAKCIRCPSRLFKHVRCVDSSTLEGIEVTDVVFHFYPSQCAGINPCVGDDFLDSG